MSSPLRLDLKSTSLITNAPSLSALMFLSDPLYLPIGVRQLIAYPVVI